MPSHRLFLSLHASQAIVTLVCTNAAAADDGGGDDDDGGGGGGGDTSMLYSLPFPQGCVTPSYQMHYSTLFLFFSFFNFKIVF